MNYVQPIRNQQTIDEFEAELKNNNYRDYLLWCFGSLAGLRCSDILRLQVCDVKGTHIRQKSQKTGKMPLPILIHPKLKKAISIYIKDKPDHEYLFKSSHGHNKPMTTTRVYQIFNKAARKVGIKEAFGTHSARKTFGYWYYEQYRKSSSKSPVFALAQLKEFFGHESESVTARYIGLTQDIFDKAVKGLKIGTSRRGR